MTGVQTCALPILCDFLAGFQETLQDIHDDEATLRLIQGIFTTPAKYLKYIARSLGWQLQAEDEAGKRAEVSRIVDFYDLKGTPYGIRFLAQEYLGDAFDRLIEFYIPTSSSSSSITEDYNSTDPTLKELLDGGGDFLNEAWRDDKILKRGRSYGFDDTERKYSYFVRCEVTTSNYTAGELRPKVQEYIRRYALMHPAGRFGYLYFIAQGMENDDTQLSADLINDLVGGRYLDTKWLLDSGKQLDQATSPLHPSESWILTRQPDPLDIGKKLDTGWHLDATHTTVGVLIELS